MTMSFHNLNYPSVVLSNVYKNNNTGYRKTRLITQSVVVKLSSLLVHTDDDSGNLSESKKKISSSGPGSSSALMISPSSKSLLPQANTVGIIGGASVASTLIFLEKLVWWSTRDANQECLPFVVCSDPSLHKELIPYTSFQLKPKTSQLLLEINNLPVVENLQHKRVFLEQCGARCIVMPCHISHAWHGEISEGCSLPFFHVGECVAKELKEAKMKPIEVGSNVRIGVLASDATLAAGFYQEKLQSQGFEVVLLDKETMDHILIPAVEALNKRDMEGARNLLRIAVQVLLIRAVNAVILASEDIQGLLPYDDPLLQKCIDPMDSLARSAIKWARSNKTVNKRT